MDIKIYPGAGHAFDQSWAYRADAADDAVKTALAFFERHLGTAQ